jgi:uncharacterized protein
MASPPFLNTNVVLRHLTKDHVDHSPKASALILHIAAGELVTRTTDTVILETVFTLQRFYRIPRSDIRDQMLDLIAFPGIRLPSKLRHRRAFDFYTTHAALSYADCYHIAFMESLGLTDIISFDQDISKVSTITRKEPDAAGTLV